MRAGVAEEVTNAGQKAGNQCAHARVDGIRGGGRRDVGQSRVTVAHGRVIDGGQLHWIGQGSDQGVLGCRLPALVRQGERGELLSASQTCPYHYATTDGQDLAKRSCAGAK